MVAAVMVVVVADYNTDPQRTPNDLAGVTGGTTAPPTTNPLAVPSSMFGPSVWTMPVSGLAADPRSDDWSGRLWRRANVGAPGNWLLLSGIAEPSNDYSAPVYDVSTATSQRKVRRKYSFPGFFNIEANDTVPWNDAWRPADGKDGFLVVVDPATGREWDFWNISFPGYQTEENDSTECVTDDVTHPFDDTKRFDPTTDLCAASAMLVRSPDGAAADLRSYTGNFPGAGGGGIQNGPGIVFPEEVASGAVRHAWKLTIVNSMFGPECSPSDLTDPTRFGISCGSAVAPGGQFERVATTEIAGMSRSETVPEGMRFALTISDADIESWLNSKGYQGARRETARVMAVSLRDYGWFITDSSPVGAGFTLSGAANPATRQQWSALGLTAESDRFLLQGLFTEDRLRVLAPPTSVCADGSSSVFYCWASSSSYER